MIDNLGRNLHYLRLSVTDRCNLRCHYCMPEDGIETIPHEEVLTFEEIIRVVTLMGQLGTNRVRLTGGEPLVRKDIVQLAHAIKQLDSIGFLGLTTNGILLNELAEDLLKAGVNGLNISLDTTDPNRYFTYTRRDEFERAFSGLKKAVSLPFDSIKVNCVLSPQSTKEDWLGVIALAKTMPVDVRLIEWMPMANEEEFTFISAQEALSEIEHTFGTLTPLAPTCGAGPAEYYKIDGFLGRVGMIHAMSHNFCASCNRLRLSATGDLKLCLFYDMGVPLKPLLRNGATNEEIKQVILEEVKRKPKEHQGIRKTQDGDQTTSLLTKTKGMYQTGGC